MVTTVKSKCSTFIWMRNIKIGKSCLFQVIMWVVPLIYQLRLFHPNVCCKYQNVTAIFTYLCPSFHPALFSSALLHFCMLLCTQSQACAFSWLWNSCLQGSVWNRALLLFSSSVWKKSASLSHCCPTPAAPSAPHAGRQKTWTVTRFSFRYKLLTLYSTTKCSIYKKAFCEAEV